MWKASSVGYRPSDHRMLAGSAGRLILLAQFTWLTALATSDGTRAEDD